MVQQNEHTGTREKLEKVLRTKLKDGIWGLLVSDAYVHEYETGPLDMNGLADRARQLLQGYGEHVPGQHRPPKTVRVPKKKSRDRTTMTREIAVSILVAKLAAQDEWVQTFRKKVLDGERVADDGAQTWILSKGALDGVINIEDFPDQLYFPSPTEDARHSISVVKGGLLDKLRLLSEHLERQFGWDAAQATKFVLTDAPPLVSEITGDFKRREVSGTSRIELSIDPAASPRQVAEYYRLVRNQIVKGRHRRQEEKHLELAVFDTYRPKGESTAKWLAQWNRENPKWQYDVKTNFLRDKKVARERLLSPRYLGG